MQRLVKYWLQGILSPFLDAILCILSSPSPPSPPIAQHTARALLWCGQLPDHQSLCLPWKLFMTIFHVVGHFQPLASFHCMTQLTNKTPNVLSISEQLKIPHRWQSFPVQKVTGDSLVHHDEEHLKLENGSPWTILPWHWGKKLKSWSPQAKNWASECLYGALISSLGSEHFVSGCMLRHFNVPCTDSHLYESAFVLERW